MFFYFTITQNEYIIIARYSNRVSKEVIDVPYPNINAERSRKGMTVEALAQALGVTRKTVYNWMAHGNIPQSALEKMATLFNCSIDYLLET